MSSVLTKESLTLDRAMHHFVGHSLLPQATKQCDAVNIAAWATDSAQGILILILVPMEL